FPYTTLFRSPVESEFWTSPTMTGGPLRSRNSSETSPPCQDCLATCSAMDLMEFDKIVPSRNPSCWTVRRVRSSREMPHRSVSASGESATINSGGREGSGTSNVESVLRSFVIHNTEIAPPNQWVYECQTDGSPRRISKH